jgi:hypothetical protein
VVIIYIAQNYKDNRCRKQTSSTKRSTGNRAALTSLRVSSGLPFHVECEIRFSQKDGSLDSYILRLFSKPFSAWTKMAVFYNTSFMISMTNLKHEFVFYVPDSVEKGRV